MIITMPFVCSICEEESTRICVRCTKDTCANHLCEKCGACSDCCDCELRLDPDLVVPAGTDSHDPQEPKSPPMPAPDPQWPTESLSR